jgi:hypothetical protein
MSNIETPERKKTERILISSHGFRIKVFVQVKLIISLIRMYPDFSRTSYIFLGR